MISEWAKDIAKITKNVNIVAVLSSSCKIFVFIRQIDDLQMFFELTLETNPCRPLPPPEAAKRRLKVEAAEVIRGWVTKYGSAYRLIQIYDAAHQEESNFEFHENLFYLLIFVSTENFRTVIIFWSKSNGSVLPTWREGNFLLFLV